MSSDPVLPLGDVCTFLNGGTPSRSVDSYWNGTIPWITGADIDGPEVVRCRSHVTKEGLRASATNLVPAGTLLLVTRTSVGKIAAAGVDMCFSQDITAVIPDESRVDKGYLRQFLASRAEVLKSAARGATIKGVTRQDVADLRIPLPPLGEQRRIAGILVAADGLRAKRRESIALLDTLTQSIFLDMFGDADPGWTRGVVLDAAADHKGSIRTGPFGSQLLHSEFVDAGVAVLGIDNAVNNVFRWGERRFITDSKYQELSRYRVYPGDVLITIMGTTGRCAVVPDDIPIAINTKHLCCISLNPQKCLPEYLHAYFLHHPDARDYLGRQGKGAIMVGLNMGLIKAMPLILPPIDLQARFAARLNVVGQALDAAIRASAEVDSLFATLQARAFRGEL